MIMGTTFPTGASRSTMRHTTLIHNSERGVTCRSLKIYPFYFFIIFWMLLDKSIEFPISSNRFWFKINVKENLNLSTEQLKKPSSMCNLALDVRLLISDSLAQTMINNLTVVVMVFTGSPATPDLPKFLMESCSACTSSVFMQKITSRVIFKYIQLPKYPSSAILRYISLILEHNSWVVHLWRISLNQFLLSLSLVLNLFTYHWYYLTIAMSTLVQL